MKPACKAGCFETFSPSRIQRPHRRKPARLAV